MALNCEHRLRLAAVCLAVVCYLPRSTSVENGTLEPANDPIKEEGEQGTNSMTRDIKINTNETSAQQNNSGSEATGKVVLGGVSKMTFMLRKTNQCGASVSKFKANAMICAGVCKKKNCPGIMTSSADDSCYFLDGIPNRPSVEGEKCFWKMCVPPSSNDMGQGELNWNQSSPFPVVGDTLEITCQQGHYTKTTNKTTQTIECKTEGWSPFERCSSPKLKECREPPPVNIGHGESNRDSSSPLTSVGDTLEITCHPFYYTETTKNTTQTIQCTKDGWSTFEKCSFNCPAPFEMVDNMCLYFYKKKLLTYDDAREYCKHHNADLASFHSEAEEKTLAQFITNTNIVSVNVI